MHQSGYRYAALAAALATAMQAHAQTSPESQPGFQPGTGLGEVIVTARKRTESAHEIPVAISAFSAEDLERRNLNTLEGMAAATPEMVIARGSTGSGAQLSLRGIGSNFTSIGIEQSVAVIVDGAYYGRGRVINEGFFDLGRVEVLKGPQALFYGKNATAGVVSITTADPTDRLEVMGRMGYEVRSEKILGEGVISGPLTSNLSARLAVRASKMFGGYFAAGGHASPYDTFDVATGNINPHSAPPLTDRQPEERELIGRLTLKWTPTEEFTATIKAYGASSKNNNGAWNIVPICPTGFQQLDPTTRCTKSFRTYQNSVPEEITGSFGSRDGQPYNNYKSYAFNGNFEYQMDDLILSTLFNYQYNRNQFLLDTDYEQNAVSGSNTFAADYARWRAFSNETRVITDFDGPVNLMLGAYYQSSKSFFRQDPILFALENSAAPADQRYIAVTKISPTKGETISGFGQAIWEIIPQLEATAGVRYTHETKKSSFSQPYVNPGVAGTFTPGGYVEADQTFNNWSPEFSLTWTPTSDLTLYGAYRSGYKSGGFSNSSLVGPRTQAANLTFGPEKASGFEAGVKSILLDNQLRINLGAYTYKYDGLQIDYFNNVDVIYITTNAGGARVKGVELDAEFAPHAIEGLRLHGSINYNRARYTSFLGPCYTGQTIQMGCSLAGPAGEPFQDLSGKPTANAPNWTGTLGIAYEAALAENLNLGLSADSRYSSSYLATSFGSPAATQRRYITLDAAARVFTSDSRWELAVIGKNLTNRFIINGAYDITGTGSGTGTTSGILSDQAGSIALPRTVEFQLTWRY